MNHWPQQYLLGQIYQIQQVSMNMDLRVYQTTTCHYNPYLDNHIKYNRAACARTSDLTS